jgi:hypothetical protein
MTARADDSPAGNGVKASQPAQAWLAAAAIDPAVLKLRPDYRVC